MPGVETEDFSAAHKLNKELLTLSADQVRHGGGVKFYEQWRRCLLFEAPHDFDSFMTYIELDRKPEKRFFLNQFRKGDVNNLKYGQALVGYFCQQDLPL